MLAQDLHYFKTNNVGKGESMKPVIGITSYYVKAYEIEQCRPRGVMGQDMLMSTIDYSSAVEKAGGIPLIIPIINSIELIEDLVEKIDGLILSGGPDIYPLLYNSSISVGSKKIVAERDRFELELLGKVLGKNKPVFGICKGFHMLNIYYGGTLYQDIYLECNTNIAHSGSKASCYEPCHTVYFEKDSIFFDIFKSNSYVNSYHHQAIKNLGSELKAVGWSTDDNLIEAVVHKDNDFVLGVQWHPEMMVGHYEEQLEIFKYFINLIRRNKHDQN